VAAFGPQGIETKPEITHSRTAWGVRDEVAMEQLAPVIKRELHRGASRQLAASAAARPFFTSQRW